MKVSVCITTFNEEKTINKLLDSLLRQSKVADEILIVDAGSTDKTIEIIKSYKNIKLKISRGAIIAKGRNLAVKNSKYAIIAMTDAGCICDKYWLERIIKSFENSKVQVVAGFYKMTGESNFQKALKPFFGIMPEKFDKEKFLPSARSIAFRKRVWEKVGGFDEKFDKAGEDTEFNLKILRQNFLIVRKRNAFVEWEVPKTLNDASKKFFYYAKGDAQSGNLFSRHNVHVVLIFFRYFIFSICPPLIFLYLIWSIFKLRRFVKRWRSRFFVPIIQLASDFAVMAGFLFGIWKVIQNK